MIEHGKAQNGVGRRATSILTAWIYGLRLTLVALLGAVLMAGAAQAQTFQFQTFEVQGNTRIETASVLSTLGVTPGQPISAGQLNDGFQRLQASGLFETVEIVPQGSKLLVIVNEYPTVNRISIEGNNRIKDEQIETLIGSQVRRVYSPAQAERDAAAISEAYAIEGRLSATVQPKIIRRSDNRVDLIFEIAEGRVSEVERLSFVGNRAFSDRRLRRILETKQAGLFRTFIGSDTFIADRVALDTQLLRDFYLSRGYADVQVLSATPELAPSRDAYFLTFRIQEGQQFRFGQVNAVSTLPDINVPEYQAEVRVKPGDIFNPQSIERQIQRLELLATRQGLTFVRATPRSRATMPPGRWMSISFWNAASVCSSSGSTSKAMPRRWTGSSAASSIPSKAIRSTHAKFAPRPNAFAPWGISVRPTWRRVKARRQSPSSSTSTSRSSPLDRWGSVRITPSKAASAYRSTSRRRTFWGAARS